MASGKDNEKETQDKDKFDGSCEKLQDFDLQMGRWCRKKYGTKAKLTGSSYILLPFYLIGRIYIC